jgi:DNA-directed RNA polymerase subunit RPC12/RpoP
LRQMPKRQRDPQRQWPAGYCARCGTEWYPGETAWQLHGEVLCRDCALEILLQALAPFRVTVGEAEE